MSAHMNNQQVRLLDETVPEQWRETNTINWHTFQWLKSQNRTYLEQLAKCSRSIKPISVIFPKNNLFSCTPTNYWTSPDNWAKSIKAFTFKARKWPYEQQAFRWRLAARSLIPTWQLQSHWPRQNTVVPTVNISVKALTAKVSRKKPSRKGSQRRYGCVHNLWWPIV